MLNPVTDMHGAHFVDTQKGELTILLKGMSGASGMSVPNIFLQAVDVVAVTTILQMSVEDFDRAAQFQFLGSISSLLGVDMTRLEITGVLFFVVCCCELIQVY